MSKIGLSYCSIQICLYIGIGIYLYILMAFWERDNKSMLQPWRDIIWWNDQFAKVTILLTGYELSTNTPLAR